MKTLARLASVASLATLVALAAATTGCAAASENTAGASSASADVAAAATSDTELVPYLTKAEQDDVHREWMRRNGVEWNTTIAGEPVVDALTGIIHGIQRKDPSGPDAHLTPSQALIAAQAMMTKNADLLGVPPAEVARLAATVYPPNGSNPSFGVTFEARFTQPGYESFPELENEASVSMRVDLDGSVRSVNTILSKWVPKLTLDTNPGLPESDPMVIAKVLGTPVAFYENTGKVLSESTYVPCVKHLKHDLGTLVAADVDGIELMVREHDERGGHRFTLGYRVHARKAAYSFVFVVDAASGAVLDQPAQYAAAADGTLWLYTSGRVDGDVSPLGKCN